MALDDLAQDAVGNGGDRERWIGVYIGVLAVVLAICAMGGGNAAKEATLKTIEASNTWAFFQAKNMRRHALRLETSDLELRLASETNLSPDGRAAIEAKIAEYRNQDDLLTKGDPAVAADKREGLDQLFERAKSMETDRDLAMQQDPYFDYGEALLQIAIVLASIALITKGSFLLMASGCLGLLGAMMTANGFTLAVALPWLG